MGSSTVSSQQSAVSGEYRELACFVQVAARRTLYTAGAGHTEWVSGAAQLPD